MASGNINNPRAFNKWNLVTTITDVSSHNLDLPNEYSELLAQLYMNLDGTWRCVSFNLPLVKSEPQNQNSYFYSGAYLTANSLTGGQIRFEHSSSRTAIQIVQLVINGTAYTSGIAMKVYGR